jgi:hypothetical protein
MEKFLCRSGKKFKTKKNHDEFVGHSTCMTTLLFFLKMTYAVSCQEENSRQKRFQVQEDFPKLCKVAKKCTGAWCLGKIHMILVSVETQSCND